MNVKYLDLSGRSMSQAIYDKVERLKLPNPHVSASTNNSSKLERNTSAKKG